MNTKDKKDIKVLNASDFELLAKAGSINQTGHIESFLSKFATELNKFLSLYLQTNTKIDLKKKLDHNSYADILANTDIHYPYYVKLNHKNLFFRQNILCLDELLCKNLLDTALGGQAPHLKNSKKEDQEKIKIQDSPLNEKVLNKEIKNILKSYEKTLKSHSKNSDLQPSKIESLDKLYLNLDPKEPCVSFILEISTSNEEDKVDDHLSLGSLLCTIGLNHLEQNRNQSKNIIKAFPIPNDVNAALGSRIFNAELMLNALWAERKMTVRDFLELRVGDTIMFPDKKKIDELEILIEDRKKFKATAVKYKGKLAFKII